MERLEDCISFLLSKAGQQIGRRAKERLASFGVTPTQYAVLKVLWDSDGQSGAEIATRLVIYSATTTGLIDRMEASGLLERRADSGDRRVQRLFLTSRARGLQKSLDAAMERLNAEVKEELGSQAKPLWSALRRLGSAKG